MHTDKPTDSQTKDRYIQTNTDKQTVQLIDKKTDTGKDTTNTLIIETSRQSLKE